MAGSGTAHGEASVYYRFEDASGRVHIVDSLSAVPEGRRAHAQRIEYGSETPFPSVNAASRPGWQMFALGFAVALILVVLFLRLPKALRWLLHLAVIGGVFALAAGAYFGWVRRTTGQAGAPLASPGALIDDAKSAVDKMNARLRAQEQELREIDKAK